jgi:arylsulfatase A-like enzyme
VVILVMDTTAASHLSLLGYPRPTSPRLEEVAREGTVFGRAFSSAPWTLPSHASLFTGLYPVQHGAGFEHPHVNPGTLTLAEILRRQGYRTLGFSNNAWIGDNTGLHQGFERFTKIMTWNQEDRQYTLRISERTDSGYRSTMEPHSLPEPLEDSGAGVTNRLVQEALQGHDFDEQRLFLFVNFLEPHLPYRPPAGFAQDMFAAPEAEKRARQVRQDVHAHETGMGPMSEEELAQLRGLYDGEVAYVDYRVGELLDFLRELGILEETLLVITSDHGEQIGDHGFLGHNLNVYDDLLHVPLVVRYPPLFAPGAVVDHPVETRDVFASVVSLVHPEALAETPVRDIHPLPTRNATETPERYLVAQYDRPLVRLKAWQKRWPDGDFSRFDRTFTTLRSGGWKLIVASDGSRELYDTRRDPGETRDLAGERRDQVERLMAEMDAWRRMASAALPSGDGDGTVPEMDEETRKKLQALGYIN